MILTRLALLTLLINHHPLGWYPLVNLPKAPHLLKPSPMITIHLIKKIVPATLAALAKSKKAKKAISPFHLLYVEKLSHIEFIHRGTDNPLHLIGAYFTPYPTDGIQQHFCPFVPYKTLHYYQNIL
jgi:hypothetical protein